MAAVTVLCAVRGPQEAAVVVALGAPGSGATVTRRCGDLAELLAAAAAGAGTVAVVSPDLPGLDREAVGRLHGTSVRVVALADTEAADRLRAMGVDTVVDDALDPAGLDLRDAPALRDAVARQAADPDGAEATPAGDTAARVGEATRVEDHEPEVAALPTRSGTVIAVWGPVGAPGRTTTAVELAAALAGIGGRAGRRRRSAPPPRRAGTALLVDADTYGASVAARLGLLDDAPGLAAVARAAGQGTLDLETLARHSPTVEPGLRVLTGITRAARWPELPASLLEVVFARARELADWVVVDCGPIIEADELLMYDTHAPQRNAATLSALAAADVVVAVGAADPIGIQRLVRGLEELREAPVPVSGSTIVVANRVRASAVGRDPVTAVRQALARYAGVDVLHTVPDDGPALDAALLAGQTLAEHDPASPASAAFAGLAAAVHALVPASV
jgi:MinD-like ATPase involved in chromosome partitioning or flagellar assembly